MSKLLRSELKEIVRECLVEILTEGAGTSPSKISESTSRLKNQNSHINNSNSMRSSLDNITWGSKQPIQEAARESERDIVKNVVEDPLLAEMIAGSHETLMKQNGAGHGMRNPSITGDNAQRSVANSNPVDLFGDAAGKWAHLAFNGTD
jgi:hypothetical protein